jgi:hypothetical protein
MLKELPRAEKATAVGAPYPKFLCREGSGERTIARGSSG